MAKLKEICISLGRTITHPGADRLNKSDPRNFENFKPMVSMVISCGEGENVDNVFERGRFKVIQEMEELVGTIRKQVREGMVK